MINLISVFDGSVLWSHAVLNKQQGAASQDPFPAAKYGGAASQQLDSPQSSCWQWTKDYRPSSTGRCKGRSKEKQPFLLINSDSAHLPTWNHILTVWCRIWVFLYLPKTMWWEMTSSWTTPHSFSQKWSLTGRHLADWLICLDKCLVMFWHTFKF